jgi:hypothetical protein
LKNIKLGFFLKSLTLCEIAFLSLIILSETIIYYFKFNNIYSEATNIIGSIVLVVLWWIPLSSPLSDRFRNVYFSLIWISICIYWIIIKEDLITSILPLFTYVFTQITRLIFKWIYKKEFIPLLVYRQAFHRYSKIENRKSTQKDFICSMLIFIIGNILSIAFFIDNKY